MRATRQANFSRWHSRESLFGYLRKQMIDEQLCARGIVDERVLSAMALVPREVFVPRSEQDFAYDDLPIGFGGGQTLAKPYTLALMCQLLHLQPEETVLEIGTETGYAAAVLSHLAQQVVSVALVPEWATAARERLDRIGCDTVEVHCCSSDLAASAPSAFDAILVSTTCETLPTAYLQQLAEGGRLVITLGDPVSGEALYRFSWSAERLLCERHSACSSVPLISARRGSLAWWS